MAAVRGVRLPESTTSSSPPSPDPKCREIAEEKEALLQIAPNGARQAVIMEILIHNFGGTLGYSMFVASMIGLYLLAVCYIPLVESYEPKTGAPIVNQTMYTVFFESTALVMAIFSFNITFFQFRFVADGFLDRDSIDGWRIRLQCVFYYFLELLRYMFFVFGSFAFLRWAMNVDIYWYYEVPNIILFVICIGVMVQSSSALWSKVKTLRQRYENRNATLSIKKDVSPVYVTPGNMKNFKEPVTGITSVPTFTSGGGNAKESRRVPRKPTCQANFLKAGLTFTIGMFMIFYLTATIIVYRTTGNVGKAVIALLVHPLIVDVVNIICRISMGSGKQRHPFYDTFAITCFDAIMGLYRRFLYVSTSSMAQAVTLVILSGIEEILMRSSIEYRERIMRRLLKSKPLSESDLRIKRKFWCYTITSSSVHEIISILVSTAMLISFFDIRFFVDLGYSSLSSIDGETLDKANIMTGMGIQLVITIMVDIASSRIEANQGLPPSDYFFHFRNLEIVLIHFFSYICAVHMMFIGMKTIPTKIYCSSPSPCDCGFPVYDFICHRNTTLGNGTNVIAVVETPSSFGFSYFSVLIMVGALLVVGSIVWLFISKVWDSNKVKTIDEALKKEKLLRQQAMEAANTGLVQLSGMNKAIATIEDVKRGLSPAQSQVMDHVIKLLKNPEKQNFDINKFLKNSSDDAAVVNFLKSQLMGQEAYSAEAVKAKLELGIAKGGLQKKYTLLNVPLTTVLNKTFSKSGPPSHHGAPITREPSKTNEDGDEGGAMHSFRSDIVQAVVPNNQLLTQMVASDITEDILVWDFNVFDLKSRYPAATLAWNCFTVATDVLSALNVPEYQIKNYLIYVDQNYSMTTYDDSPSYGTEDVAKTLTKRFNKSKLDEGNSNPNTNTEGSNTALSIKGNAYHNNLHGADVLQAVIYFALKHKFIGGSFTSMDLFAIMITALIHDFNHPGLNTTYVVNDWPRSVISSTFGSESPLEKHHIARAFSLLRNEEYNFIKYWIQEDCNYFRRIVTECVLATDLATSMAWLASARPQFAAMITEGSSSEGDVRTIAKMKAVENAKLLKMKLIMKCADVGHPARLLDVHLKWSASIREEFFSQGDKERLNNMTISPLCDRHAQAQNYPQGQIGFITYVSKPIFSLLDDMCEGDEKPWMNNLMSNVGYWHELANAIQK